MPSPDPRPRPPQFASWADAVIFVFSLENESSFEEVTQLHALLSGYQGASEVALALVGTQGELGTWHPWGLGGGREGTTPASPPPLPPDKISSSNPRVIEDARAQALCGDMKRCLYYETCATYGLNVDRVFTEGGCPGVLSSAGGSSVAGGGAGGVGRGPMAGGRGEVGVGDQVGQGPWPVGDGDCGWGGVGIVASVAQDPWPGGVGAVASG